MTLGYALGMVNTVGASLPKRAAEGAVVVVWHERHPFVWGGVNSRPSVGVNLLNVVGCGHALSFSPTVMVL
jgi:hypothetical protein